MLVLERVWKQFTVYAPGARNIVFAKHAIFNFLPAFADTHGNSVYPWHFLFEPSCLVRFSAHPEKADFILKDAERIAKECGLVFEAGDSSNGEPVDYSEMREVDTYGSIDLVAVNQVFLEAVSNLSLEMRTLPPEVFLPIARKHVHLLLNALGMNYGEEVAFHRYCMERSGDLYKQYGAT